MISIKLIYIICSVLLNLVASSEVKLFNPNELACNAKNDFTNCSKLNYKDFKEFEITNFRYGLIISKGTNEVKAFDPTTETFISLVEGSVISFDFYKDKTLYRSTISTNQPILSLSSKYPNLKKDNELWFVRSLAVDFRTEKIYAYDDAAKKIDVFDIQGKHHGILLSDLNLVIDIALDPYKGLLFILHPSSIQSANMDGSELRVFIQDSLLTAFTLDLRYGNLYWSQGFDVMVSLSYSKDKISKVTTVPGEILSLAVLDQNLYYTSRGLSTDNIWESATLSKCSMVNNICKSYPTEIQSTDPRQIKAYNPTGNPSTSNPCEYNNGGCEHLCMMRLDKISCACDVGWQINADSKSCSPIKEYILYVRETYVRGRIMEENKESFIDAIQPKRLRLYTEQIRPVYFDFDAHRNFMVFSDDRFMYRVDLSERHEQLLIAEEREYEMRPAIDWTSNNLYYLRTNQTNNKDSYLMLRKADRLSSFNEQKVIYTFVKKEKPRAIVIHPGQSKIYVSVLDVNLKKASIYAFNNDGSRIEDNDVLEDNKNGISINETYLAIDHQKSRLYWFNKDRTAVQHGSLEGPLNYKTIDIAFIQNPTSINIHQEWMYINNGGDVWRIEKLNGKSRKKILSTEEHGTLSEAKGYGISLQPILTNHPCSVKNGGCSGYCIAIYDKTESRLKRVCKCNDNQELAKDKMKCTKTKRSRSKSLS